MDALRASVVHWLISPSSEPPIDGELAAAVRLLVPKLALALVAVLAAVVLAAVGVGRGRRPQTMSHSPSISKIPSIELLQSW